MVYFSLNGNQLDKGFMKDQWIPFTTKAFAARSRKAGLVLSSVQSFSTRPTSCLDDCRAVAGLQWAEKNMVITCYNMLQLRISLSFFLGHFSLKCFFWSFQDIFSGTLHFWSLFWMVKVSLD
jgi:hypothetical protein